MTKMKIFSTQTHDQTKRSLVSHLGDGGVTQDVIWRRRLLDPERPELSQSGHPADGLGHVPPLVCIDHLIQKHFSVLLHDKNGGGTGDVPECYQVRSSAL